MHIKADAYIEKASKLAEGEVEFVVSTGDWDAHGERINIDGIDLKEFKKNPDAYPGSIKEAAQRVGLWSRGKLVMDSPDEMDLVFDVAVFDTRSGQSRALDR